MLRSLLVFALVSFLFCENALSATNTRITGVTPFVSSFDTQPSNGENNPYGVVFIPAGFTCLSVNANNILVTNFNNVTNLQGTGSTVVKVDTSNATNPLTVFYTSPNAHLGLSPIALVSTGYFLIGNVANDGAGGVLPGVIQVLDCNARLVTTIGASSLVTYPWGITVVETVSTVYLFVSNVIDGNVVRINYSNPPNFTDPISSTVIAKNYTTRPDPNAFVIGPAGSVYQASSDTLYLAAEGDNQIYAIPSATKATTAVIKGNLVYSDSTHLHGPLGLVFTPGGNLLTANADSINTGKGSQPSTLTEFTTTGTWVASMSIDGQRGSAFQLAYGSVPSLGANVLGVLDDNTATVNLYLLASSLTSGGKTTTSSASALNSFWSFALDYFF